MSWNSNTQPKDISGNPIAPGVYRIAQDGTVRLAWCFESEDCTLYAQFGREHPQRVDELSQFCVWTLAEQSEIDEAIRDGSLTGKRREP